MFGQANALDLANFQSALVGQNDVVDQLVADGLKCAYINAALEDISQALIDEFRPNGVHFFATYCFTYWNEPERTARERDLAIDLAKKNGIKIVIGDAEWWGASSITPAQRVREFRDIQRAAVEAAGLEFMVYTGRSFWMTQMGNSTEFARNRLIDANWRFDLKLASDVAYGGWTACAGQQIASSGTPSILGFAPEVGGVRVDYDYIFDQDLLGENDVTEDRVRELINEAIEARLDDGEAQNAALVSPAILLSLMAQLTGLRPNTYSDPLAAEIAARLSQVVGLKRGDSVVLTGVVS